MGARHGLRTELHARYVPVTWQDFVAFYSIPFMGARRLKGLTQQERLEYLAKLVPSFEHIQFRWAFVTMTKPVLESIQDPGVQG